MLFTTLLADSLVLLPMDAASPVGFALIGGLFILIFAIPVILLGLVIRFFVNRSRRKRLEEEQRAATSEEDQEEAPE